MKLATVSLNLTKEGHHVVLTNVTPAELLLLVAEHHVNSGGKPLEADSIKVTGDTTQEVEEKDEKGVVHKVKKETRTASDEVARLRGKYAGNKVNAVYQGAIPSLPETYEQAIALGLKTQLPTSKLTEVRIV